MELKGSTFLVSGGSSGLGAACVRALAGGGGNVVIADLNAAAGEALAAELGGNARFVRTDVTDEASVRNAVQTAVSAFGGLQGAVLCAGIGLAEKILGKTGPHPLASFAKVINVNLVGTFNVLRLAAAAMSQGTPTASGERGVIVMTASVAAFDGQIGQAAYAASKGGIQAFTHSLALEYAKQGLRAACVAPGSIKSGITDATGGYIPTDADWSLFPRLMPILPTTAESSGAGMAEPNAVAGVIAMLVSDDGAWITGTEIRMDGGTHA